jgi:uncharacterized protein
VNQQQLKFGMKWGLTGILIFGCNLPVRSLPPLHSQNPPVIQPQPNSQPTGKGQKLPESAQITIRGQTIRLEVAKTAEEQEIGLMYRTSLAKNRGMLFVFAVPIPVRFWMKNTLIPLDMLFMSNGVVKYIGAKIPPCKLDPCPSYGSDQQIAIDSVIELPSGRAAELKLKVGDRIKVLLTKPKGLN